MATICQFKNLHDAIQTAMEIIQCGIPITRVELMDGVQMAASIQYSGLNEYQPLTTLFFEFTGSSAAVHEQVETTKAIASGNNELGFSRAESPEGHQQALDLDRKTVARALSLNGSCSGEHGVGMGKLKFLETEHGPGNLSVMRALKNTMDPHHILNPGKLLPPGPVYTG